ncbi:uncharacterized protein F4812DRAFT_446373 [Daldinia caldariorum]|uniref:uncharacterized protein n=1 Tax=Daldinia caldariorum TaxID=326644 RepID=UPI002008B7BB|nr:uncharacterized protein F4812DRAFT_446373 [Daldinia caldariorum]KAI1463505.1 hypothetical protein F4812DRAFT_446373 [Daldinia caldariorum]
MTSTLLPFLYQTRTILRGSLRGSPRISSSLSRSLHATPRQLREDDEIPFASYVPKERLPPDQSFRSGTITPSERRIFEKIFADIRARGLKPFVPADSRQAASPARTAMSRMQKAAEDDANRRRPATVTTTGFDGLTDDRRKALLKFPPELRAAAGKAFDTIKPPKRRPDDDDIKYDEASIAANQEDPDSDEGWKVPDNAVDRSMELEAQRSPERTRVEGLITAAKTDFEIWDVLEKEVFTMPARLGFGKGAPNLKESESEEEEEEEEEEEVEEEEEEIEEVAAGEEVEDPEDMAAALETIDMPETIPEEVDDAVSAESDPTTQELDLYIHGPLYPEYLLLALRRLNSAFRTPSPLVFSILPRIKELGLESYMLGVSTPFYNELLEIYWTRRGDISGILELLEEMRHCGLSFDAQTASLLGRVNTVVTKLATKASSGSFGKALMTMPEYDRSVRLRVRDWYDAVDTSVSQSKA